MRGNVRRTINRLVLGIVDSLDDVSLLAHTGIRKNRVSGGQIFQVGFKRTDVNGWTARNVVAQIQRGRDFLDGIEPGELPNPHTHRVARVNQTVRARLNPAVGPIRICGGPVSGAVDFARLNWAVAN